MTAINSAQSNQVGFQCKNCKYDNATYHPLPAISSYVIPGSGQFLKGETGKGVRHLATDVGLIGAFGFALKHIATNIIQQVNQKAALPEGLEKIVKEPFKHFKLPKVAVGVAVASGLGLSVNHIRSSIDAYKPQKTQKYQISCCGQDKPKYHSLPAIASFLLPGAGQLMKDENKKGYVHLGIYGGMMAAGLALIHKTPRLMNNYIDVALSPKFLDVFNYKKLFSNVPMKVKVIATGLAIASVGQRIVAAVDAYKPKKS